MTAKDLKNALLQEAVQGKLVPQIASEGNARDLLEEIRKEKLSHELDFANAKSGKRKSKKETALAGSNPCDITEYEIPFDIPENWCWCRLGELVYNHGQKTPEQEFSYIDIGSIDNEHQRLNKKENIITPDKAPSRARKIVFEGDVIYSTVRPYLHNICIIDKKFSKEPIASTGFAVMASTEVLFNKYLFYYLLSPIFDNYANATDNAKGVAYPAINDDKLYKGVVPLPPLAEQKRIVAAIEKFMPLIEEYGKKETELKALNEQIGTLTKKAILQEAVQGKLVPQIAAEGNAKDLLEEIRKEKLSHGLDFANAKSGKKKSKKETALAGSNPCDITEEEIPFDIPENWCWCRLGEICNEIKRGKSPKYADKSNFLAFAQKCNVKTGGIDLGLALYLDENSITRYSETDNLVQGDIVINSTGGGTMGRVGLYETQVPAGIKGVYPDSHVTVIRSIGNINQHYLYYVLKLNQPVLEKCGTGSTNQTELKPAVLADFVIPLPPLAEQKRIVDTIEKMLPLCEKLGE
ncbi:MAG: restriction endonuclease subunit S [Treponema succinifaciens]|uniref:restriction endonuclease subunit S n=1 Tax=Treponema succinifaciens TaxID=167 RepID=UPI002A75597B|nr:restriction endonuclease subunit S [Treponema succinifaciens]MDY2616877.1 restriction endonuclease subunit S [Treponema succinifaciens]